MLVVVGVAAHIMTKANVEPSFTSVLVAAHSQKCLTTTAATRGGVTLLQQWPCSNAAAQRFTFEGAGGGFYRVRSAGGNCLSVQDGRTESGVRMVEMPTCDGGPVQQFILRRVDAAKRSFMLVVRHSIKCVDVYAGGQSDGVAVLQWACGDPAVAGNQIWHIPAAEDAKTAGTAPATDNESGARSATPPVVSGPRRTLRPGRPGTNDGWGASPPPADAALSRAYQVINSQSDKGYRPRGAECAQHVHARYWTWGPDGLVYPTWHPPRDRSGCSFGHEHGDDPRSSRLFATTGWPAFGYTNQMLAPSDPRRQRDEDHVGHKVHVANRAQAHRRNDLTAPITMTCDTVMKFHQGTHSRDAFTNNLHELTYNARCQYAGSGEVIETRFTALVPLGHPGEFGVGQLCTGNSNTTHRHVGPATPPESPATTDQPGLARVPSAVAGRFIPDAACAVRTLTDGTHIRSINEVWAAQILAKHGQLKTLQIAPLFTVANPTRYYNPDLPGRIGWTVDLCYAGAKGDRCDQVRKLTRQTGQRITHDDQRSPFNGADRMFSPGVLVIQNTGPTTLYTDVFGQRFSTQPFPGSIRQHVAGNHPGHHDQGNIPGKPTNYAHNPADRIHAPN